MRGHQVGDDVLAEIARRMTGLLRNYDICARWGGDEFVLLIGGADIGALSSVAAKIVAVVSGTPVQPVGGDRITMSVSVGACIVDPEQTLGSALDQADMALYAAKHGGRNGFVIYDRALHGRPGRPMLRLG